MKEYGLAVFIGRFQPFHNEHLKVVEHGLKIADKVLILVGSASASRNIKNPFTFEERFRMIADCFEPGTVEIAPIDDYFYSEETWLASVQNTVEARNFRSRPVTLIGCYKDASSYYLNSFPQWGQSFIRSAELDATKIREIIFQGRTMEEKDIIKKLLPPMIYEWITDFFFSSSEYEGLAKEFYSVNKYKAAWKSAPYPPTFVCVDAVVIKSGHVLLVSRGEHPGKGLFALPGGFVRQDETLIRAAVRELREETKLSGIELTGDTVKEDQVFDYPGRSLRGRTITHAFFWDLGVGKLPEVEGSDDARDAFWIPINQLKQNDLYEDHYHIIQHFIAGNQRRR